MILNPLQKRGLSKCIRKSHKFKLHNLNQTFKDKKSVSRFRLQKTIE